MYECSASMLTGIGCPVLRAGRCAGYVPLVYRVLDIDFND